MSSLRLRVNKYVEGGLAPEVSAMIYKLSESGAQRDPGHAPMSELIPVSDRPEQAKTINLEPGRYYVETVLPSGEILADSVALEGDASQELVLSAEDSPHEWLSWQHLVGNVQPKEAIARKTAPQKTGRGKRRGAKQSQSKRVGGGRQSSSKPSRRSSAGRSMRLYVGNLSLQTSKELKSLFSQVGKVESAKVVKDRDARRPRSSGFVEMATKEEGRAAIRRFNAKKVGGRSLTVQEVKPREYRSTSSAGIAAARTESSIATDLPSEVSIGSPIQCLSSPHPALAGVGETDVWEWLANLSPMMPDALIRELNHLRPPLDIPHIFVDSMHAVYRVSWSKESGVTVHSLGTSIKPEQRYFVVVSRRQSVELVSLPIPWIVVTTGREADIEIAIQEPVEAQGFCTSATARDEQLGMLLGYLSSGSLPTVCQIAETAKVMLYYKFENPFAAAAGAYALVGTAQDASDNEWHDWVWNLMNRFPHIPDGAIQWGQLKLRMRRNSADIEDARTALKLAYRRGLPFYSMGVRWLMDGLELVSPNDEEAQEMLKNVRQLAWRTHYQQPFTIMKLGGEPGV
ncbi:MAG: hypothetical protein WBP93_04000 [Pyrinomonadaceae bacterium]